jgi:hypothetical protein
MEIVSVPTFQFSVDIIEGWNMVSIPGLHFENQNVDTWWQYKDPSASVFKYNNGYQVVTELSPGAGYWMRQSGARTYNTGDEWPPAGIQTVSHGPIPIQIGWNLISVYECPVDVNTLTTTPPTVLGSFYGYLAGYFVASTLIPGYGYWLKSTINGWLNIPSCNSFKGFVTSTDFIKADWGRIIITDNTGRSFSLYSIDQIQDLSKYDLPPLPPAGSFDIRFASGRNVENLNSTQTIEMSGVKYPLTLRVENINIKLQDETGELINVKLRSGEELVINDESITKLAAEAEIIPDEYSLEQNYPNPFNPSTTIEFSLPEDVNNVTLNIYNSLGEKVSELVNTNLQAGRYSYNWDAKNFASGIYIYELRTNNFVSIKKMMLLK